MHHSFSSKARSNSWSIKVDKERSSDEDDDS